MLTVVSSRLNETPIMEAVCSRDITQGWHSKLIVTDIQTILPLGFGIRQSGFGPKPCNSSPQHPANYTEQSFTITGCTQTTPTNHLRYETQVLVLQDHINMRGTQFLAAASATVVTSSPRWCKWSALSLVAMEHVVMIDCAWVRILDPSIKVSRPQCQSPSVIHTLPWSVLYLNDL